MSRLTSPRRPGPVARRKRWSGFWAQGARKLIDQTYTVPLLPQAGLIAAVERYFEFMQRMAQMNRDLTVEWVQAASALSGAAWEQAPAEPAGDVVRSRPPRPGGRSPARLGAAGAPMRRASARTRLGSGPSGPLASAPGRPLRRSRGLYRGRSTTHIIMVTS